MSNEAEYKTIVPGLRARRLGDDCPLGFRSLGVEDGYVAVISEAYVFGRSIDITMADSDNVVGSILTAWAGWWHIVGAGGSGFRVRFNEPGAIILVAGGTLEPGAQALPVSSLAICSSLPVSISAICAAITDGGQTPAASLYNKCYFRPTPLAGVPGLWAASGQKDSTSQGLRGPNLLITGLAGPAYIVTTITAPVFSATLPPAAGSCTRSPLYLCVEASDWSGRVYTTNDAPYGLETGVKLGDLSSFVRGPGDTLTFTVAVDADVTGVKLWFPADETGNGGAYPFWGVSCEVFGFDVIKTIPAGGGLLGGPSGTSLGGLPGTTGWNAASLGGGAAGTGLAYE